MYSSLYQAAASIEPATGDRCDRVGPLEARCPGPRRRQRRCPRSVEVREQVAVACLRRSGCRGSRAPTWRSATTLTAAPPSRSRRRAALHVGGVNRRLHALDDDQRSRGRAGWRRSPARPGSRRAGSRTSSRPPAGRRASRAAQTLKSERRGVDEHVGGVREQRERGRRRTPTHLDRHERDDQRECDGERPDVRFGADPWWGCPWW